MLEKCMWKSHRGGKEYRSQASMMHLFHDNNRLQTTKQHDLDKAFWMRYGTVLIVVLWLNEEIPFRFFSLYWHDRRTQVCLLGSAEYCCSYSLNLNDLTMQIDHSAIKWIVFISSNQTVCSFEILSLQKCKAKCVHNVFSIYTEDYGYVLLCYTIPTPRSSIWKIFMYVHIQSAHILHVQYKYRAICCYSAKMVLR